MASDLKHAHVVEIVVDEEHQHKIVTAMNAVTAMHHHPLLEISQSPGHLLLLKIWQREEDLSGRRIALRETRMDSIKRDIFQLCCFFFMFHAFYLTLLFTSSVDLEDRACKKWWIPVVLLASTSIAIVFLVQMKLWRYWKANRQLQREKSDGRAVGRCIQELRMKGGSFDLSKEPQNSKRMKSSSVEIKWRPLVWFSQYLITISLVCFTAGLFPHVWISCSISFHSFINKCDEYENFKGISYFSIFIQGISAYGMKLFRSDQRARYAYDYEIRLHSRLVKNSSYC